MTGPFLVWHLDKFTAKGRLRYEPVVLSVKAVETLDEARGRCHEILRRRPITVAKPAYEFPLGPTGGEIALSDGSQVVVEAKTIGDLVRDLGLIGSVRVRMTDAEIVELWNSRFGVEAQSEGVR